MTTNPAPAIVWRDPPLPRRGRASMITDAMITALVNEPGRWAALVTEVIPDQEALTRVYGKFYAARKTAMRRHPNHEFVVRIERNQHTAVVLFGRYNPA